MFDFQQVAESEGRQSEAKMWSVLVGQIWAGLTGYCCAPVDLKEVRVKLSSCSFRTLIWCSGFRH